MTLREVLRSLDLEALLPRFEEEGVALSDLPALGNEELQTLGVARMGDRLRLRELAKHALSGEGAAALDGATRIGGTLPVELSGATRVGHSVPGELPGVTRLEGSLPAGPPSGNLPERVSSYRVLGLLGTGGMGSVLRARHVEEGWARRQGGDVAIKLVHAQLASDPAFRERFFAEAELGRRIQHPSVVTTHEVITDGAWLGMVMSLVEGEPLSARVRPGGMSVEEACKLLEPIAGGLDHLHGLGIVHRDLKPGNVIVRSDGSPVLLDLGIAKDTKAEEGMTRTNVAMGTSAWMAPEQADAKTVTGAADRYALGLMAYALISGRMPWAGQLSEARVLVVKLTGELVPLRELRPDLPVAVSDVIARMVALNPEERFLDSKGFVGALLQAAAAGTNAVASASGVGDSWGGGSSPRNAPPVEAAREALQDGDLAPAAAPVPAPAPAAAPAPAPASAPAPAPAPAPEAAPAPEQRTSSAGPVLFGVGAVALVLLALLGVGAWWMLRSGDSPSGEDLFRGDTPEGSVPASEAASSSAPAGPVPIASASASSNLRSQTLGGIYYTFGADNLIDGSLATSWQPLRDTSASLRLSYPAARVTELRIANGFQHQDANGDLFASNRRVAALRVSTSSGFAQVLAVPDSRGWSTLRVEESEPSEWMEIRVEGTHDTQRWPDVAISELELVGVR